MKHIFLFESYNKLNDKEKALLKRINAHKESWVKILLEFEGNKNGFERFIEHFNVLEFVKYEPNDMASLLAPIIKDSKNLRNWISENSDQLPESFKESVGVYSDLKNLGF